VLVHAAGLFPARLALDSDEELFDRVLRVNSGSALAAAVTFSRACRDTGRPGTVVMVSSGAADHARTGTTVYAASKAALNAIVRGLALETAPHRVRVNAVAPGFVDVDSTLNPIPENYRDAVAAANPRGRVATPADIAPTIVWLASDAADWVTGQVVHADGGAGRSASDASCLAG
jgi:3-oxoacyl-[acyl-carrier protein] reductase